MGHRFHVGSEVSKIEDKEIIWVTERTAIFVKASEVSLILLPMRRNVHSGDLVDNVANGSGCTGDTTFLEVLGSQIWNSQREKVRLHVISTIFSYFHFLHVLIWYSCKVRLCLPAEAGRLVLCTVRLPLLDWGHRRLTQRNHPPKKSRKYLGKQVRKYLYRPHGNRADLIMTRLRKIDPDQRQSGPSGLQW